MPGSVMQRGREIEFVGTVKKVLPGGKAEVILDDERCIVAEISARIKVRLISITAGQRVACEVSPFDWSKVRIVGIDGLAA